MSYYYLCGVRSLERQRVRDINRLDEDKTEKKGGNKHDTDDMIKWVNGYVKQVKIKTTLR